LLDERIGLTKKNAIPGAGGSGKGRLVSTDRYE